MGQALAEVRRGLRPPGTGVHTVVSHLVSAGNGTGVLCKSNKCFSPPDVSPAPGLLLWLFLS